MYENIVDFKKFIVKATNEQIERIIMFINMVGFWEGYEKGIDYNDHYLAQQAVEYAKSNYDYVEDFLSARLGINVQESNKGEL